MDLKGTREFLGLSQGEIGRPIGKSQSTISSVEAGLMDLDLEDMVVLQKELGTQIDWHEPIPAHERGLILNSVVRLINSGLPVRAVFKFAEKLLRDPKVHAPAKKIALYAQAAQRDEGLLPPGVE